MESYRATELEPGIVQLELTRPHRRNALSSNVVAELHREIDRIGGDPAIRAVILTGEGASFRAGADIKAGPTDSEATEGTAVGSLFGSARSDGIVPGIKVTGEPRRVRSGWLNGIKELRVEYDTHRWLAGCSH